MATSKDNRVGWADLSVRSEEDFFGENANDMPMDEKQTYADGCRLPTYNSARLEPNVQPKNYGNCPPSGTCVIL